MKSVVDFQKSKQLELLEKTLENDYKDLTSMVIRIAWRKGCSPEECEDLAIEIVTNLLNSIRNGSLLRSIEKKNKGVKFEELKLSEIMSKIAYYDLVKQVLPKIWKKKERQLTTPYEDIDNILFKSHMPPDYYQLLQREVDDVLKQLSPLQRSILEQKYYDDDPIKTIAKRIKKTTEATKVLLYRARMNFAKIWGTDQP